MSDRTWRVLFLLPAIFLYSYAIVYSAETFHSGGTGYCSGCHTTHNSDGNVKMTVNNLPVGQGNLYLLRGQDQSSTCLVCHERPGSQGPDTYHVSTSKADMPDGSPPVQLTPGGDFGWLKKTYGWVNGSGGSETSQGERHGHNAVAADFGFVADSVLTKSPGGGYAASSLQCTSCHDPHGKFRILKDGTETTAEVPIKGSGSYGDAPDAGEAVGTYRLLAGAGYESKTAPGVIFVNKTPAAVAPANYNRSEAASQTRVAYGSGMSEWCANCHAGLLRNSFTPGVPGQSHPAGKDVALGPVISGYYNSYVHSGDLSGSKAGSYLSLVPFETGDGNDGPGRSALLALARSDDSMLEGPNTTCNVSCTTCHRAHASGWEHSLRWNGESDYVFYKGVYPGTDNGSPADYAQGRTSIETSRAYYNQPKSRFASSQRSLCDKCHPKD